MSLNVSVGNVNKKVVGLWVSVGGVWKQVSKVWSSDASVFRTIYRKTLTLAGTFLTAEVTSFSNSLARVTVTYNVDGTVTRAATKVGTPGTTNAGSSVPNWNTNGGSYASWDIFDGTGTTAPTSATAENTRVSMAAPLAVELLAVYNPGDPPGEEGTYNVDFYVWDTLTSPTPISVQRFELTAHAGPF